MAVKINSFKTVKPKNGDIVTGLQSGENVNFEISDLVNNTSGTERQVIGFDQNGKQINVTLGWKQLSDMPSVPPFPNGVLTGTAFQEDGSALFAFIHLDVSGEHNSGSIPLYSANGTLKTADAVDLPDAVNLKQLNSRMPDLPTTDGEYVLKILNKVATWVLKS